MILTASFELPLGGDNKRIGTALNRSKTTQICRKQLQRMVIISDFEETLVASKQGRLFVVVGLLGGSGSGGSRRLVDNSTESEVGDDDRAAVLAHQAVVGLEVPVDDVERVQVLHGSSDVTRVSHAEFPRQADRDVVDDVFESSATNVLEHQVQVLLFREQYPKQLYYLLICTKISV
jgi:hypothetical protein